MQKKPTIEQRVQRLESSFVEVSDTLRSLVGSINNLTTQLTSEKEPSWRETFGDRFELIKKTLKTELPLEAVNHITYGGGTRIPYVTGYYVYSALNLIFGPENWSYNVNVKRVGANLYSVLVTLTIAGVSRTNGSVNKKVQGNAPEQLAMKSAITNAFKRAASNFGPILGGSLYSSNYIKKFNAWKDKRNPFNEENALELVYNLSHGNKIDKNTKIRSVEVPKMMTKNDVSLGMEDSITNFKDPNVKENDAILLDKEKVKVSALIEDDKTPFDEPIQVSGVFPVRRIDTDVPDNDNTIHASSIIQGDVRIPKNKPDKQPVLESDDIDIGDINIDEIFSN